LLYLLYSGVASQPHAAYIYVN